MAVLIEALSVIIRREVLEKRFHGGWQGFVSKVPNGTLCCDRDLVRVGFMSPSDVGAFVSMLEAGGLVFDQHEQAIDLAVIDQQTGLTLPAPWLEYGQITVNGHAIIACWLAGESPDNIALPRGWKYEGSLSARMIRVDTERIDDRMKFLRRENGCDVYLDQETGKEVFAGRPVMQGDSEAAIFTRLEAFCKEALDIEAKMQPLLAAKDEERCMPLFDRLNGGLLPAVEQILQDSGKHMAFAHFSLGLMLRILHR